MDFLCKIDIRDDFEINQNNYTQRLGIFLCAYIDY